jgi:hypothetical protein
VSHSHGLDCVLPLADLQKYNLRPKSTHGIDIYKMLVGKTEGKGPVRSCRRRWEDDIKIILKEICCAIVDWIYLAQDKAGSCGYGNDYSDLKKAWIF